MQERKDKKRFALYTLITLCLSSSLLCSLIMSLATNRGDVHRLRQCHQASAIAPLNVMTLRKKTRAGSRLAVMNVSQSV